VYYLFIYWKERLICLEAIILKQDFKRLTKPQAHVPSGQYHAEVRDGTGE